ncbi:MAG TPA: DUF1656 domain-containing protein [Rhodoblastus sp.]|nr:DUF1656 domain-containing protein [Rhodoblastus sp.]
MPKDIAIAGVYITPFVGFYFAAFLVFLAVRFLLARSRIEQAFWRPELAETGLFLIILSLIARLS